MATDERVIKDAQYRKGLSIAWFNATNAAIEIMKGSPLSGDELKERIIFYRDWLLEEHKDYYASVIANVGVNYDKESAIKLLRECENMTQLNSLWIAFSADERHDKDIRKVAIDMKAKLHEEAH